MKSYGAWCKELRKLVCPRVSVLLFYVSFAWAPSTADQMRSYSVDVAIQELDDKRMLRIRQEVRQRQTVLPATWGWAASHQFPKTLPDLVTSSNLENKNC